MSITGLEERASTTIQAARAIAARASRRSVTGDAHPQLSPWLTGSSSATSQTASRTALVQLIRPPDRTGDSGTWMRASTATTKVMIIGIQNSHRQPRVSLIGPASTVPMPPPTAMTLDNRPIADGTRPASNSSRTMPKAIG
jgi:hypothetical protein